jgi:hypothetical protein
MEAWKTLIALTDSGLDTETFKGQIRLDNIKSNK